MKYLIYALVDPRTGETRYVGKSCSGLLRPTQQGKPGVLSRNKRHSGNWIRSLQRLGFNFSISILYQSENSLHLEDAEIFWIAEMRVRGHRLTNFTLGGEGTLGTKHSEETKAKIRTSNLGRKRSPETCARIGKSKRGQDTSKATEAARLVNTGHKMKDRGPEWRAKLSAARKAQTGLQKRTPEQLQRMSEAQQLRRLQERS